MKTYAAYFAIEKKLKNKGFDFHRSELISQFSKNKKTGLKQLTESEYKELCKWLNQVYIKKENQDWQNSPENKMRRKIFILFSKMQYSPKEFQEWVVKYGKFHKPLNKHSLTELTQLVTQAELVYKSYLTEINK